MPNPKTRVHHAHRRISRSLIPLIDTLPRAGRLVSLVRTGQCCCCGNPVAGHFAADNRWIGCRSH